MKIFYEWLESQFDRIGHKMKTSYATEFDKILMLKCDRMSLEANERIKEKDDFLL